MLDGYGDLRAPGNKRGAFSEADLMAEIPCSQGLENSVLQ